MNLTITQAHKGLLEKKFSAVDLAKGFLEKASKDVFLTVCSDLALTQAKETDQMISQGKKIPLLAGIPSAIKDNILVKGIRCTAASKILENYVAPYDATVIKKLKENMGVFLGKTNLDEFAMGASTENSAFGTTKNPWDSKRVPGGSSGGSAAAVASGQCLYALGSDTGGSIRQPASFCGVVGLKPTYGMVSRYGLIAFASSLDQIGPITKNVEDARIVYQAIKGKDEMDSTSLKGVEKLKAIKNIKIGVPKEYFAEGIDPKVKETVKKAIGKYADHGCKVEEISLPYSKYAIAAYYIISPSEASANLARYDGIRYGYSKKGKNLSEVYFQTRGKGFGEEVRRRIMIGVYALSSGYYDAYYLRAQKVRTLIRQDFEKAFKKVDLIMTPTTPTPAFKIGDNIKDPLTMYLSDICTAAVNLSGNPGLSVPCGKVDGLPVGLQIIGRPFEEERILEAGELFEEYGQSN